VKQIVKKPLARRAANRLLHLLARILPGAGGLRPFLHRLRGVKIGTGVFIGDEVYIENEYPEAVEIEDGVQISLRAVILAHTRGPGRVIIESDAFIGASTVIAAAGGRTVRIGRGAVIGPLLAITNDVAPRQFVTNDAARLVATATVALSKAESIDQFIRGLVPNKRRDSSVSKSAGKT
jgi:acyl-[acyl carrier protein]--UDP-N-acetylglucosamine O-acyltransferase